MTNDAVQLDSDQDDYVNDNNYNKDNDDEDKDNNDNDKDNKSKTLNMTYENSNKNYPQNKIHDLKMVESSKNCTNYAIVAKDIIKQYGSDFLMSN